MVQPAHSAVMLRVEGRLVGDWVRELRQSVDHVLAAGQSLRLHLAGVEYVDSEGLALLVLLRTRGVSLTNCSPFLQCQLEETEG